MHFCKLFNMPVLTTQEKAISCVYTCCWCFILIRKCSLRRLAFICPAHISKLSEEVALTLMYARNAAFAVRKQLVSRGFLWAREVGSQYHAPLQEVCGESTEQRGFRPDSIGPACSAAGIILFGQEIQNQSTPAGTSPCLSTPRPATHGEEIKINLRSNVQILTPSLLQPSSPEEAVPHLFLEVEQGGWSRESVRCGLGPKNGDSFKGLVFQLWEYKNFWRQRSV